MKKMIFATHNAHKLEEVRTMLEPLGVKVLGAGDVHLPDVEETGETFKDNALLKAYDAYKHLSVPVLAEDAGLCISALNDEPGVYTKRYAEQNGGFPKVFDVVTKRLAGKDTSARFVCTMALVVSETEAHVFEGVLEGHLVDTPRGNNGFGYDPIFVPTGYDRTLAEMSSDEKNSLSHRFKALQKVVSHLTGK